MLEKLKAWAKWVYDWLVMITAAVVSFLSIGIEIISSLSNQDLQAFMSDAMALKTVALATMIKTAIEVYRAKKAA